MIVIVTFFTCIIIYSSSLAEFKEIPLLEGKNNHFSKSTTIKEEKKEDGGKLETSNNVDIVTSTPKEEKMTVNHNVPLITEEQLLNIIEIAKASPSPSTDIENRKTLYFSNRNQNIEKNTPNFIVELKETLDKYEFKDKNEDLHIGQVTAKELTSDKFLDGLEFGIGVAYKNQECYEDDILESRNPDIWNHTPIYATGKYKISDNEVSSKYLKFNLGYAIGEYDNNPYNEEEIRNGLYYGIGGGIDYDDISLDLLYQVNKDAYEKNNSSQDDSRITFSIDYKLEF